MSYHRSPPAATDMSKKVKHTAVSNYYIPSAKPVLATKGASNKHAYKKSHKLDPKQRAREKKASKKAGKQKR